MTEFRHFEDFHVGETIDLGAKAVSREEIIAFAREFDPQPFHLDDEAARHTLLGGLAASGWHTCSIFMRLLADNLLNHSTSEGSPGIETLKWLRPVRPGDTLHLTAKVLETKPSRSKPSRGAVRFAFTIENQAGEAVATMKNFIMFTTRGTAS